MKTTIASTCIFSRTRFIWLFHRKNVHAWELPTHVLQYVLFSCAVASKVTSSTSSQENPFVFHKVTVSTVKQHETQNTRNLFQVTRKNIGNLHNNGGFMFLVHHAERILVPSPYYTSSLIITHYILLVRWLFIFKVF